MSGSKKIEFTFGEPDPDEPEPGDRLFLDRLPSLADLGPSPIDRVFLEFESRRRQLIASIFGIPLEYFERDQDPIFTEVESMSEPSQKFDTWAIVELFGHAMIVGRCSEVMIAGGAFLRVDVPETEAQEAFTKFYGAGAVYAITPTDERTARAAIRSLAVKPIELWKLNIPQLSARVSDDELDDDELGGY